MDSSSDYSLTSALLPVADFVRRNGSVTVDDSGGFGTTNAVFLTSSSEIWLNLVIWTMISTAAVFGGAAVYGVRVNSDRKTTPGYGMMLVILSSILFGGFIGFLQGCLSAALIAAISVSIPYPVGIDIAAGLGMGQAIIIIYFHLGRADFIHR
jgi:hypothetical protein